MAVKQGATSGILKGPTRRRTRPGTNVTGLKKALKASSEAGKKKKVSPKVARRRAIALAQKPKIPGTNLRQ